MATLAQEPLYATIAASGHYFSVTYRAVRNPDGTGQSGSLSGYSDNVFRDVSGIPLIDYRTMDFTGWKFPIVAEASLSSYAVVPLETVLRMAAERGATITTLGKGGAQ